MSTKLRLKRENIPFTEVILEGDLLEKFIGEGMASAPVVVVTMGDGATWTWNGYRHENIARLAVLFAEELAAAA